MPGDFLLPCLNHARIRTDTRRFLLTLSESYPHSDSSLEISSDLVGITPLFGLMPGDFLLPCLNHARIRTDTRRFLLTLSESYPHSDSSLEISSDLVGITPLFGLMPGDFLLPCLNHARILTHTWGFLLALSESHHYSDSCLEISYCLV